MFSVPVRRALLGTLAASAFISWPQVAQGQQVSSSCTAQVKWTKEQDHQNMMEQLGLKVLRDGPSGNEKDANHANYDEAKANPFPTLPDALTMKNGTKVTTSSQWWQQRRPRIVADFEQEVLGHVPANVPKITWTVAEQTETKSGAYPVVSKHLIGRADNAGCPGIAVNIEMTLVTPKQQTGRVPVMVMVSAAAMRKFMATHPPNPLSMGTDPPATEQLIAGGWGYVALETTSIQADSGDGLRSGIIGLANHGEPRKPGDWGVLRAWAWGASRALDYLETDPSVDAKRVGIEGVSRYGKAALVAMAFDPRFAVVLIGSSGEGGTKPHRRNFGEAVENLTGTGEYHWMAGNFLKYGAAEGKSGSKDAGDLPVDANELIALCAPRPTFISYGIPEHGDSLWLDQHGSYMAAVAAGPVYRLLGVKDLGVEEDYRTAKMPPVNVGMLDGTLTWRQHDGGHTDAPNWKYFIPWADRMLDYHPEPMTVPANEATFRRDADSLVAHTQLLEKAKAGKIDLYFEGDSITRRWGALDYPNLLANWKQTFYGWNAADFGWGGDETQHILWRLKNGELDGVNPKVVVLLAGTNNVGDRLAKGSAGDRARDVAAGLKAVINEIRAKAPGATIIVTAIFPRNDNMAFMPVIDQINEQAASWADGKKVRFLNINKKLADDKGVLFPGMMNARDKLHPELKGYEVWGEALKPILTELLGPQAAEDHAPPPTGDPSKATQ